MTATRILARSSGANGETRAAAEAPDGAASFGAAFTCPMTSRGEMGEQPLSKQGPRHVLRPCGKGQRPDAPHIGSFTALRPAPLWGDTPASGTEGGDGGGPGIAPPSGNEPLAPSIEFPDTATARVT